MESVHEVLSTDYMVSLTEDKLNTLLDEMYFDGFREAEIDYTDRRWRILQYILEV